MWRASHGRMTDAIAFELPVSQDWLHSVKDPYTTVSPPLESVEPALLDAINAELPDGYMGKLHHADTGRGASGVAIAWEIVQGVSDTGGALAFVAGSIHLTKRIYNALRSKLGRRPMVSLGAAIYLAAADLTDRLQGSTDFSLFGADDMSGAREDGAYTGEDLFWIAFLQHNSLFVYLVHADGEVVFLRKVERHDPRGLFGSSSS
jgi:hypothetical protein